MQERVDKKKVIVGLLNRQRFNAELLDYSVLEQKKALLEELALTGNSAVSIFDMYTQQHVFYSSNYASLFGFQIQMDPANNNHFIEDKMHPDDIVSLSDNGIALLRLFYKFTMEEKARCKFINEYRIRGADQNYIRVIEQNQPLAFDQIGNIWLSLSIIDIAPNQTPFESLKSQIIDVKTGAIFHLPKTPVHNNTSQLSHREIEVLKMIKGGLLSKQISDALAISVHTVNTHRQRILKKMKANSTAEAIYRAMQANLL